jgi:hypothetical protein
MAPRAQTLRAAQHRGSPHDRELSSYHMEILTVDHSGLRVWRVQRSLHAEDLICRFRKGGRRIVAATKD